MQINIKILSSAYLLGEKSLDLSSIKELVPQMTTRRRLTRASKILITLHSRLQYFDNGRIICGSAFGELESTANILNSLKKNEPLSPTDFQNSVYNTAVSYLSILQNNQNEILTISSGDKTSLNILKVGALKAVKDEILLLLCFETLDIPKIEEVNQCITYLESGVALVIQRTHEPATLELKKSTLPGIPNSISEMLYLAQHTTPGTQPIVTISL